jgi:uncharacterized repeat protein (TIGR02543 family)
MNKLFSILISALLWTTIAWAAPIETVTTNASAGVGSFRQAISNVDDGGVINMALPQGTLKTITLATLLPKITKSFTLNGQGTTITVGDGIVTGEESQILYIDDVAATVIINGVHFANGRASNYGGAIYNKGVLILNSCIFSGNRTMANGARGGAIYNYAGTLSVNGCTFYGNSTTGLGGAICNYFSGASLLLTGNLFDGNTASNGESIYSNNGGSGSVSSAGYNVYAGTNSGFTFNGANDQQITDRQISPVSFRPVASSAAIGIITDRTALTGYPEVDFYGNEIPATNANAGAVQGIASGNGFVLQYESNNILSGTVNLVSGTIDADGFTTSGSVTLVAEASVDCAFLHWIVNGAQQESASNTLNLTMNEDKKVQAVFRTLVLTVTSIDDNATDPPAGSLREALFLADDGNIIRIDSELAGKTIVLAASLPTILKSITIEGSGITISGDSKVRIMQIGQTSPSTIRPAVTVNRVHFTNGSTSNSSNGSNGGAIRSFGKLTLNACIFSKNTAGTGSGHYGGAVRVDGATGSTPLAINGCTFYENTGYYGGAISTVTTAVTLTGNLFYGNSGTSTTRSMIHRNGGSISFAYNVTDNTTISTGTAFNGTGDWIATTETVSAKSFRLLPGSVAIGRIAAIPANYPSTGFYGSAIVAPAASGAVQETVSFMTVTYNLQYDDLTFSEGGETLLPLVKPEDPVREGFIFSGWYREAECINAWNFSRDVPTGNLTLYALWTHVVMFNSNGGTAINQQIVRHGAKVIEPSPAPVRIGHTFDGWCRDEALTDGWDFQNDVVTQHITLYAKWTVNTYTVTFESNGGTAVDPQTIQYGAKVVEPAPPVREQYIFNGWYREASFTNAWNFASNTVTQDITLYAQWNPDIDDGINNRASAVWNVYPDQNNKKVIIGGLSGGETICIFDLNGRRLLNVKATGNKESISTGTLSPGIYLVRIADSQIIKTVKIVKH